MADELPPVTNTQRDRILSADRTPDTHRDLLGDVAAMNAVQSGGTARSETLPSQITVAAWNVERCLFPLDTAKHLGTINPDIVLLSEVDQGMARTGQKHTTRDMADALGMAYLFGVEFHELDLGGPTERQFCSDDVNALVWHGNTILSSVPFCKTAMIRLDDHGHWFIQHAGASDPEQPRLGGRMALLVQVETEQGTICIVSTHLESNPDEGHHDLRMQRLLSAIEDFAPDMPVLIGGDLNTGNHLPPNFDWRREVLFKRAEKVGYAWDFTAPGTTTRPSLITPHPSRVMKLDWIAGRGFTCLDHGILPAETADKKPLSDHECVWCRAEVKG